MTLQQAFFITGTDTGVGKTHVTCALLHASRQRGWRALGMKPVAAGVETDGHNTDVTQLQAASSVLMPTTLVNPFLYTPPIAPHIAAAEAGRPIALAPILDAFAQLQRAADLVWVEGVGGFRVPLGMDWDTADLAQALRLPVVLVVGMRLGCLNHALLTAEAIIRRGLLLAGWVANCIDPDMSRIAENLDSLRTRLDAPLLGVLPHGLHPEQAAPLLQLEILTGLGAAAPGCG